MYFLIEAKVLSFIRERQIDYDFFPPTSAIFWIYFDPKTDNQWIIFIMISWTQDRRIDQNKTV